MSTSPVMKPPFSEESVDTIGPLLVDRRTKASGLQDLAASFASFTRTGSLEPWTMPYEEIILVLDGEVRLDVGGTDTAVVGHAGDLITLQKGTTVTVSGDAGTRLLACVTPANWRDIADAMPSEAEPY